MSHRLTDTVPRPVHLHRPAARPAAAPPDAEWSPERIEALMALPFMELVHRAHTVHREHWPEGDIELASLLSVKTGGCPEDCGYCPQSARHPTGVKATRMMEPDEVLQAARAAQAAGATRFCMGAAWRSPNPRDLGKVATLVREVHALGLQTCANSIFYGDKLLVTGNPDAAADRALLARLDLPVSSEVVT